MRIVVLCSSPYSETGCAVASRLAQLGKVPVGALTLPSWDRQTLVRKLGQWGLRESANYAVAKLSPRRSATSTQIRNPYLDPFLRNREGVFRNMQQVASAYGFSVKTSSDHNSPGALAQLKQWSPDLVIFTGGNILRNELLKVPRLGVLNSHLALLPEIRGMSSPEWSLLCGVPLGITIHLMDSGIDTGPILFRREFEVSERCDSLTDLRNRMIAEGIGLMAEAIDGLQSGSVTADPQNGNETARRELDNQQDSQFFVMHERLKNAAGRLLQKGRRQAVVGVDQSGGANG